ncbi:thiol-disulfide oxidoreductase [compost metagenome]
MRKYIAILAMLLFTLAVHAGQTSSALKVGDKIALQKTLKTMDGHTIDFDASKPKIIVLEFFDTYCASCIESMPKLKALQKEMGDKIEIYMTTWQDNKTIEQFYKKNKYLKEKNGYLPTIVSDSILHQLFPHKSVPHSVWIMNGEVKAITHADYVKKQYLSELLASAKISVPIKDDFKELESVVENNDLHTGTNNLLGYVELSKYNEQLEQKASVNLDKDAQGRVVAYFNNMDVFGAYLSLWAKIKKPTYLLLPQRIIWNVKDSSNYTYSDSNQQTYQEWIRTHGISYKRVQKTEMDESAWAKLMLADLDAMLGLEVNWKKKTMPCLVLKRVGKNKATASREDSKLLKAESTSSLTFTIDYSGGYPPTVDEVKEKIAFEVPKYKNLEELNHGLENYGVRFVKELREIEVLEFKERGL